MFIYFLFQIYSTQIRKLFLIEKETFFFWIILEVREILLRERESLFSFFEFYSVWVQKSIFNCTGIGNSTFLSNLLWIFYRNVSQTLQVFSKSFWTQKVFGVCISVCLYVTGSSSRRNYPFRLKFATNIYLFCGINCIVLWRTLCKKRLNKDTQKYLNTLRPMEGKIFKISFDMVIVP